MKKSDTAAIAKRAFEDITARFPHLTVYKDGNAQLDLSMTLQAQAGLLHEVTMALDGDALHFNVGNLHLEWFPCSNPLTVNKFVDAVVGFLSGNYRVLEHHRGSKCVAAQLQRPYNGGWITVGTWSTLSLPIPWRKTFKELRNN